MFIFKNNKIQINNNVINNNDILFDDNNYIYNGELNNNNHIKNIYNYPKLKKNFNNLLNNEILNEK